MKSVHAHAKCAVRTRAWQIVGNKLRVAAAAADVAAAVDVG